MKNYREITLKYIKENKKRSLLTVVGIIVSLSLISGVGFLFYAFRDAMINNTKNNFGDYEVAYLNISMKDANILKSDVDLYNVGLSSSGGYFNIGHNDKGNLDVRAIDEVSMDSIFRTNLVEGRLPGNNKEIIVDRRSKKDLDYKIGKELILTSNKEYKYTVVGFYESTKAYSNYYEGITLFNEEVTVGNENSEEDNITVYFSLKDKKGKVNIATKKAENMGVTTVDYNNELLVLRGESSYGGVNNSIGLMAIIVLSIIVLSTIFLIYNAINISVAERITQFGVLRSIGATPKQIRNIVLREGLIMCLIAVPFGIIFGFLGVDITVNILSSQIENIMGSKLNLIFYPNVVLLTMLLGVITILIASYGPANSAGKVSLIDILKNNGNTGKERIKYYKGTLIKKIFAVEGWIAYKNIRKNSKRFTVTILSLSISLIMFIVFNAMNIKQEEALGYLRDVKITDAIIYAREHSGNIERELLNIDGIDKVYKYSRAYVPMLIDKEFLNKEFLKNNDGTIEDIDSENALINEGELYFYNNEALEKINLSTEKLGDNGVVLINNISGDNGSGQYVNTAVTTYKLGDTIKIPKFIIEFNENKENNPHGYELGNSHSAIGLPEFKEDVKNAIEDNEFYSFEVKGIIEKNIFNHSSNVGIILPEKIYSVMNVEDCYGTDVEFAFNSKDNSVIERISSEAESIGNKYGRTYRNNIKEAQRSQEINFVINVFIYGFITMVTLIGIVNVINTISLNILLKKREFGTLGTIGMSRGQLVKMVILEGVIHGIIVSVSAGIASFALVKAMIKVMSTGFTITGTIPISPFIIGCIGCIGITLIASLIPLRKLNNISLVDTIRNQE
ncbi:MAG: FtsX-like permease family protein [Clostridium sp.]